MLYYSFNLTLLLHSSFCDLFVLLSTSSVHCHCQLPWAPQPTYIHPCHHNPLAPIRACEWQPHSPVASDSVVAASVPREPTAGGRSIEGALIITNHLPGREPWHIFITLVIKAITDYHQDIKLTRHLERLITQRDETSSECNHSEGTLAENLAETHRACSFTIHASREL